MTTFVSHGQLSSETCDTYLRSLLEVLTEFSWLYKLLHPSQITRAYWDGFPPGFLDEMQSITDPASIASIGSWPFSSTLAPCSPPLDPTQFPLLHRLLTRIQEVTLNMRFPSAEALPFFQGSLDANPLDIHHQVRRGMKEKKLHEVE
jgi:hypothetical protein